MDEFVAKLKAEQEKTKNCPQPVIDWLYEHGVEEDAFRTQFMLETKSLGKLWDYVTKKARDQAKGASSACVEDSTVFAWMREYFALDDAAEVLKEKERKEAAKAAEDKRKAETAAKKAEPAKYQTPIPTVAPTPMVFKKSRPQVDGQISFDALLGGTRS